MAGGRAAENAGTGTDFRHGFKARKFEGGGREGDVDGAKSF